MKIYILLFSLLILFYSCKSREYIELKHRNYLKLYNDEIHIKISPLKYGDSAIVKIFCNEKVIKKKNQNFRISHVKKYTEKVISIEDYKKIIKVFSTIREEDLKQSRTGKDCLGMAYFTFIGTHGGSNSLIYRKGILFKKFSVHGMSDLYGSFYSAIKLISESGELNIERID